METTMKKTLVVAVAVFGLLASNAVAADLSYPAPPPEPPVAVPVPGGWSFVVAPYMWAAGLSGEVGAGGQTADIDLSFGDVLDALDIGVMGVAEARHGRFGIFSDLVFAELSATDRTPFGVLANKISATSTSLMWTAAAEYRLVQQSGVSLDVMAGLRLFSIGNSLAFKGGALDGFDADQTETWVDPIVGLKGSVDLTARLYLTGWAMAGGFGVSSDSTWDLMAGAGYRFNEKIAAVLGYRAAGVDYEHDGFVYDTVQQGPFTGVAFRF